MKYIWLYIIAIVASLGGLLSGYDTGVISGALLFINETWVLPDTLQGFLELFAALSFAWLSLNPGVKFSIALFKPIVEDSRVDWSIIDPTSLVKLIID